MNRGDIVRVWLPLCAGLLGLRYVFLYSPGPHALTQWIGLGLGLIGLGGVILARYTLGRSFSVAPKATELVTRGIYTCIRNPIYVFGAIFFAGILLMLQRPYLWIVLLFVILMQTIRARQEARLLEAKFGDAYREYRARTWF